MGARYNKKGADFDLCEAEFAKLGDKSKAQFVRIARPGAPREDCALTSFPGSEGGACRVWHAACTRRVQNPFRVPLCAGARS